MNIKNILAILLLVLTSFVGNAAGFPDYTEHDIFSDAWPVYSLQSYHGKVYGVQLYQHNKGWEMRLIEFSVSKEGTMKDTRYWKLDDGKTVNPAARCYNASMVELQGTLMIYISCNSASYFYTFATDEQGTATLTKREAPATPQKDGYQHSMLLYKDYLVLAFMDAKGKFQIYYTKDNPASGKAEWHRRTSNCTAFDQSDYWALLPSAGSKGGYSHEFAATNWIGVRDGKMTEEMVFVVYNYKTRKFSTYHLNSEDFDFGTAISASSGPAMYSWKKHVDASSEIIPDNNYCFSLRLVPGMITGVGADKSTVTENNPIQVFISVMAKYVTGNIHQRQIISYEYHPDSYSFNANSETNTYNFATNLPYGMFGACSIALPMGDSTTEFDSELGQVTEVESYQRYICLLRGAWGTENHFTNQSHYAMIKSNRMKVKKSSVETADLVRSENGRSFCTLLGVIEGAPPTAVDNDEMYEKVGNVSSITFGSEESQQLTASSQMQWGQSNIFGYDSYSSGIFTGFSVMGGFGQQHITKDENSETYKTYHSTSIYNNSERSASTGYYLFDVPVLDRYVGQLYNSNGNHQLTGAGEVITFMQKGSSLAFINYRLDNPKMDADLRVENPLQLEQWQARGMKLFPSEPTSNRIYLHNNINIMTGITDGINQTKSTTHTKTKVNEWKLAVECHFYKNSSGGNTTYTNTTTTTAGRDIKFVINPISSRNIDLQHRSEPIQYYSLAGYYLDETSALAQKYYADLIARKIMSAEDRPFIICWNVTGTSGEIYLSPGHSGLDSVASEGMGPEVEYYNLQGLKVAPEALAPGIYIRREGHQTTKFIIR